jgi:nitric oxide synthase oxygenase domain/subunit
LEQVAEELDWTPAKLSKRMLEVKLAIASTGTYQHTAEELQLGARLAWRNSTKSTLVVFLGIHLKYATAATSIHQKA